jgi:hypothetical protein
MGAVQQISNTYKIGTLDSVELEISKHQKVI